MKLLMRTLSLTTVAIALTACASTQTPQNKIITADKTTVVRDADCKVNDSIQRNAIPHTPNNMSLPSFGRGVIGWAGGPEGAQARIDSVIQADIATFKAKGVNLDMVKEWQAFYENETQRNPCNPTAPLRAQLMKKIALLWLK